MVADIVDFLIQQKEPCDVDSLCILLCELVYTYFKFAGVLETIDEVRHIFWNTWWGGKMYNLYQEILQGKYDSVEELGKTTSWIGEEYMEELKRVEEEELISVRAVKAARGAMVGRRKRLKFQAYFV
ncbi:hypothetical protein MKX03_012886 [Papaver bracteatum]|nr:hypothetical protein MKX03_012886 [Papaver bracteatum]